MYYASKGHLKGVAPFLIRSQRMMLLLHHKRPILPPRFELRSLPSRGRMIDHYTTGVQRPRRDLNAQIHLRRVVVCPVILRGRMRLAGIEPAPSAWRAGMLPVTPQPQSEATQIRTEVPWFQTTGARLLHYSPT